MALSDLDQELDQEKEWLLRLLRTMRLPCDLAAAWFVLAHVAFAVHSGAEVPSPALSAPAMVCRLP